MKRTLILVAIAAISHLASAQSKDERAIRAAGEEWQRALAERDIDKVISLHAPDAVYMLSHQPLIRGVVAIRSGWSEALKLPNYKVRWTPTKIEVASPRIATEYGTYTESYTGPDGKVVTDGGNYVTVWHKINGKWRVAIDAPNTTSPLPQPVAGSALSDADRAVVEADVRRVTGDFVDAARHVDTDRVMGYFSRSSGFAVANNGVYVTSRDEFRKDLSSFYNGLRSQDISLGQMSIVPLTPNTAVATGIGTVTPTDSAGKTIAQRTFNWTFLWVHEPDGWRILHGHQSIRPANQ